VTARKLGERESREEGEPFRKLVEISFDGIVESVEGVILEVSPSLARALGYQRAELVGKPVLEIVAPESAEEVRRRLEGHVEGRYEVALLRKDGRKAFMEAAALTVETRGRLGHVVALRDVTERYALEDQLRQAQKLEAVGRLAGGVAHDFNNLLTVILSEIELLRLSSTPGPAALADALRQIEEAARRAAALTRQLLTFSRRDVAKPVVLDPVESLRGLEKMLRRVIGEDIELEFGAEESVGRVRIDPSQFEQVIMNLVVNARDAMPNGGRLRIGVRGIDLDQDYCRTQPRATPGRYVAVSASDEGVGMSEEVRSRIFDPFFTTKPPGKGTGLGLATSWGIVRDCGGHIGVTSQVGVGTTMEVYLPRVDEAHESVGSDQDAAPVELLDATVLVVEDEESVRTAAARALERLGCRVLSVKHPAEALELLASGHRPNLLLTDVVMPGMSGLELADRARRLLPEIRVLFATGYTSDIAFRDRFLEGSTRVLMKPYTPSELSRRVRDTLADPS
jgi:PAS domain S-box-containing protein